MPNEEVDFQSKRVIPAMYNKLMSNPLTREAVSQLDGVAEAIAVRQQANALLAELDTPPPAYRDDVTGFFASGKIDKAWIERVGKDEAAAAVRKDQIRHVVDLINLSAQQLDSIAEFGIDDVLSGLDALLQELLQPLKAAANKLDGVETASDAMRGGLEAEWRVFAEAAPKYERILAAQKIAVSVAPGEYKNRGQSTACDDPRASRAVIENIAEVWPYWNAALQPEWSHALQTFVSTPAASPWPDDTDGFLLWCIRNGAVLRVPDLGDM